MTCSRKSSASWDRYAGLGDVIICSVKEASPNGSVKKGEVVRCVVGTGHRTIEKARDNRARHHSRKWSQVGRASR